LTKLATIAASSGATTCNTGQAPPARYEKVVVFSFENRSWSDVGGTGFTTMPYAHSLATSCSYFTSWTEADTHQNSATQYVSQGQGDTNHTVLNDCAPSATCQSTADNIFRQMRNAGKTAVNYVEGATAPCSASGNAAKHIPALYYRGADDSANCTAQVRPYSEFDPTHLPAFAFVTPTQCNDGHDCANATVDLWMQQNIAPVIASADYQAGKVLVEIWYDEGAPVPNLYISPSAHPGPFATGGIGYASTLKLWEDALGLPCLATACAATDLRPITNV
ncbi:MAG: alkaline phosphatase family protein, partial [Acidimicrobiia bacterium]